MWCAEQTARFQFQTSGRRAGHLCVEELRNFLARVLERGGRQVLELERRNGVTLNDEPSEHFGGVDQQLFRARTRNQREIVGPAACQPLGIASQASIARTAFCENVV
jgi:hypothetical protein